MKKKEMFLEKIFNFLKIKRTERYKINKSEKLN